MAVPNQRARLAVFALLKDCPLFVIHKVEVSLSPVNKELQKWSSLKIFKLIVQVWSKHFLSELTILFSEFFLCWCFQALTLHTIEAKVCKEHAEWEAVTVVREHVFVVNLLGPLYVSLCSGKPYGADDFLPVLMYVLARSNLTEVLLNVEYMMELMDPALQLGEGRVQCLLLGYSLWKS